MADVVAKRKYYKRYNATTGNWEVIYFYTDADAVAETTNRKFVSNIVNTAGSESITADSKTLNVVTRDTTQSISGQKTFTNTNGIYFTEQTSTPSSSTGLAAKNDDHLYWKGAKIALSSDVPVLGDDILDYDSTNSKYTPYTTQQNTLSFDTSSTNPIGTSRLNLNGYLYATKVYSNGSETVNLADTQTVTGVKSFNNGIKLGETLGSTNYYATLQGDSTVTSNITLTLPKLTGILTEATSALTANKIILGDGNSVVKASSYGIHTNGNFSASDDTNISTDKAIATYITGNVLGTTIAASGTDSTKLIGSDGKVPMSLLPDIIGGQLIYGGTVTGAGVATLTDNAKVRLGTSSATITLTNDTTAITGYEANEGIYYIASSDGNFASLNLLTGDWLISTGSGWSKIDNTDAVTGVKGYAENSYRIGNVAIDPQQVGISAVTTAGSESVTVGASADGTTSKTLNVVTRDTAQTITGNKSFDGTFKLKETSSYYATLQGDSTATGNVTLTLPKTTGTLALVGDNNHTHTITANATDGIFDLTGTNGSNAVTYSLAPYDATTANSTWVATAANAGKFYLGTVNPSGTTRLNYNGHLYAKELYSNGYEVINKGDYSTTGDILVASGSASPSSLQIGSAGQVLAVGTNSMPYWRTQSQIYYVDSSTTTPTIVGPYEGDILLGDSFSNTAA